MVSTEIVVSALDGGRYIEFKTGNDGTWVVVSYDIRAGGSECEKNAIAISEASLKELVYCLNKILA